jgi:hypothetical protein
MRRLPRRLRLRVFRLMASALMPLLAVAGVAEQMCWCAEDGDHDADEVQAHESHRDAGAPEIAVITDSDRDLPGGGDDSCTCVRAGTTLCELSQPVHVPAKAPLGGVESLPSSRSIVPGLGAGWPARARDARSEHPPPLFLSHCSWRC